MSNHLMPANMSNRMSGNILDNMSEYMSNRMLKYMSDKMSVGGDQSDISYVFVFLTSDSCQISNQFGALSAHPLHVDLLCSGHLRGEGLP